MYCTIVDVQKLLPVTVTVGSTNIGTPIPGQQTIKRDSLTTDDIIYFIRYATQEIDSRLRPFYTCPLRRTKSYETEILNNLSSGTNVLVSVLDSNAFSKYETVRLQENFQYENCTISDVPDSTKVQLSSVTQNHTAYSTNISLLEYPDPIPVMAARLAISYAFDKLFNAEQQPDISQYGVAQRKLAMNIMDSILTGAILLFGQEHTGRRFVRMSLFDSFKSPAEDIQFGRESNQ